MADFDLARRVQHLIIQPADLRYNPPESYLFVQDGLIISCGVLYALFYLFCMARTYADRTYPGAGFGGIQYLCLTMAYEVFYAFTTTSTWIERIAFFIWFELDLGFALVALRRAHTPAARSVIQRNMTIGFFLALAGLKALARAYPDDREQITAYWTGILLQFPVGWVYLYLLLKHRGTQGHSLETWLTRYLGCFTAYGVFLWRYFNIPANWAYVGSPWSIGIIILTLIPETIYPFVYISVYNRKKAKAL